MAIRIYTEPNQISSPYRPNYFDVSSDLGTIIRMIADVYVDGTLVTTIDKDPKLGFSNQFRFEVGDVLKKYLTSDFVTINNAVDVSTDLASSNNYYIRAFEVLDNSSTSTFDTSWSEDGAGTNYTQSSTLSTFNGVNQHQQTLSDYIASSGASKFITNRPNLSYVPKSDFRIGILTEEIVADITVNTYDGLNGSGSLVNSTTSSAVAPIDDKVWFGIQVSSFASTVKSFSVTASNPFIAAEITETMTFNLVDACEDDLTVYWQNHWGEFDNYLFKGKQNQKTKNKTTSITNRLNLDYSVGDRGKKDLTKANTRTFTAYTDTRKSAIIEWLAEIGESVDVKIIKGGEVIPVNVTNITSTIEDSERTPSQIAITFEEANKRINQIG